MSVTLVASGALGIGTSFRRQRGGPERALIDWFLGNDSVRVPSGCRLTIFQEPRLESGFADLVIVFWRERQTWEWNPARAKLTSEDIRLLHYLHHNGPAGSPFFGSFLWAETGPATRSTGRGPSGILSFWNVESPSTQQDFCRSANHSH
jgi:hypothetical protein